MFGVGCPRWRSSRSIAVLVFGPDQLPELARQAGRFATQAAQVRHARPRRAARRARPRVRRPRAARPRPPHHRPQAHRRGDGGQDDEDESPRGASAGAAPARPRASCRRTTPRRPSARELQAGALRAAATLRRSATSHGAVALAVPRPPTKSPRPRRARATQRPDASTTCRPQVAATHRSPGVRPGGASAEPERRAVGYTRRPRPPRGTDRVGGTAHDGRPAERWTTIQSWRGAGAPAHHPSPTRSAAVRDPRPTPSDVQVDLGPDEAIRPAGEA